MNSIQYLVEFDTKRSAKYHYKTGDLHVKFCCDDRIEDGTALRDLEKKVHFLMQQLMGAGVICTRGGNAADVPSDIDNDGNEVANQFPTST